MLANSFHIKSLFGDWSLPGWGERQTSFCFKFGGWESHFVLSHFGVPSGTTFSLIPSLGAWQAVRACIGAKFGSIWGFLFNFLSLYFSAYWTAHLSSGLGAHQQWDLGDGDGGGGLFPVNYVCFLFTGWIKSWWFMVYLFILLKRSHDVYDVQLL